MAHEKTCVPDSAVNSPETNPPLPSARWIHWPRNRRRQIIFFAVYAVFCVGLVFAGVKVFWHVRSGVPLTDTATVWDYYYPELRTTGVQSADISRDDDLFDVLLLGGSVVDPSWGTVEEELRTRLKQRFGEKFRLFNLARSAHTSRDSLLKYSRLSDKRFDLVIVYDGINDVRMNQCPRDVFRDDYSHCAWYQGMEKRLKAGRISLITAVGEQVEILSETIPLGGSNDTEMRAFGREIKTPPALYKNEEAIVQMATERGDLLVLMTCAAFIPGDYTEERFKNQKLEYSFRADGRSCVAEMWGEPEAVVKTVAAQNEAIRDLAKENADILMVDQATGIEKSGRNFVDPCHLTDEGCREFVERLWQAIERRLPTP